MIWLEYYHSGRGTRTLGYGHSLTKRADEGRQIVQFTQLSRVRLCEHIDLQHAIIHDNIHQLTYQLSCSYAWAYKTRRLQAEASSC